VTALLSGACGLPEYYLSLIITSLIWGISAMSLNLFMGYAGLISLGHAAFFGVGAYTVVILSVKAGLSGLGVFFLGILVAGFLAACVAPAALRARGVYFMLITLAIAELLYGLAVKWRSLTGGDDGLPGLIRPEIPLIGNLLNNPVGFYYFVLIWFVLVAILMMIIVHSPAGRTLVGIRENDLRMKVLGYNVWLYRYLTYISSALLCGLAGALQAYHVKFVSPSDLGTIASAKMLLMVIVGSTGTFWGPILGAFLVVFLENLVSAQTERWLTIMGAIYIFVVLVTPKGVMRINVKRFFKGWFS
jgi:branched-chain amino acid transport system permease protein